jgi:hypothetical protein
MTLVATPKPVPNPVPHPPWPGPLDPNWPHPHVMPAWADLVDERVVRVPVDPWPRAPFDPRPRWTDPTQQWPEVKR